MLQWYDRQTILPWQNTYDPYLVWLSEIMLQQTTVLVVSQRYGKWLQEFPTIQRLAQADLTQVLRAFEGLGYYARARHLHQTAQYIAQRGWPASYIALRKLPGLGDYTTKTVLSRCFKQPVLAFDVNMHRLFGRLFMKYPLTKQDEKALEKVMEPQLIKHNPAIVGQAFMRFAQGHCKKCAPDCQTCLFAHVCIAAQHGAQTSLFPQKKKKKVYRESVVLVLRRSGSILAEKRTEGIGKDMYSLPRLAQEEFALFIQKIQGVPVALKTRVHTYTHHSETLIPYFLDVKGTEFWDFGPECSFYNKEELDKLPFMAIYRDILQEIQQDRNFSLSF